MTSTRTLLGLATMAVLASPLAAQTAIVIRGGTVHTLAGAPIANGTVVIQDGKITAVGANATAPAGAQVIDASGLHVYPGLFDAVTRLGLTEIDAVDVTVDMQELGEFNPQLFAATAVHPASEHIPVTRANGITHAVAAPLARPGGIGGQAALIDLDGWTIEEMQLAPSVGFVLAWPRLAGGFGGFGGGGGGGGFGGAPRPFREIRKQYDDQVRRIDGWVEDARRYDAAVKAGERIPRDLKLEALARATRGELPFLISVDAEREIRDAVAWGERQRVKIVILGGNQAYRVRTLLAEKHVPVILGPSQSVPADDAGYDERYAAAGLLHQAGVQVAIATFNSADSRTLPYEAGSTVSFGLPPDEALKAVTLSPAQILGVADRLGTIEVGKIANVIVTDGDPLEIRTQIKHAIIAGRDVSLDNKHLQLYTRYRGRPKRP
ncbi:MAG TPA: amidohydrolase family protein [Gemmatimonadales bacterium]|jgi:imidazolonepropionase-like amidohydrolase|nr:amidohydrolase family protein [Gemmatimonadales bacterium]